MQRPCTQHARARSSDGSEQPTGVSGGSRGLQEIVPLWCKPWTTTGEAWLVVVARLKDGAASIDTTAGELERHAKQAVPSGGGAGVARSFAGRRA
jgi:hypothetical protein